MGVYSTSGTLMTQVFFFFYSILNFVLYESHIIIFLATHLFFYFKMTLVYRFYFTPILVKISVLKYDNPS